MNFTREPIIETVITPKEGCKLVVRSSKAEGQEEYLVDAVEVVSFGQALFFRCTEKPKPFLVPVGDYEIVEAKENRVVLKNAQFERTIKIGGGREAPIRREEESSEDEQPQDRKPRDRRHRRRRSSEEREEMRERIQQPPTEASPGFTSLIPPPTTLISDTIGRYKEMLTPEEKPPQEEAPPKEEEGESNSLNRVTVVETRATFTSDWNNFLS